MVRAQKFSGVGQFKDSGRGFIEDAGARQRAHHAIERVFMRSASCGQLSRRLRSIFQQISDAEFRRSMQCCGHHESDGELHQNLRRLRRGHTARC